MEAEFNPYSEPVTSREHFDEAVEKGPCKLTVVSGAVQRRQEYFCLLSGKPCGLVTVTLRRMLIAPPIWIGTKAEIILPLSDEPFLAPWQYLRMLRPWIVFAVWVMSMMVFVDYRDGGGLPMKADQSRFVSIVATVGGIGLALGVWIGLGRLLKRCEFVRLLYYIRQDKTVTVRFSRPSLARRARDVLVISK